MNDPKFMAGDPELVQLRLLELYDDTYGIINHDTDPSPFSLASYAEQEDPLLLSGFGGYFDEYLNANIFEHTGITFDKWMTYTYAKQKMLIERSIRYGEKKAKLKSDGLTELEKTFLKLNAAQPKPGG